MRSFFQKTSKSSEVPKPEAANKQDAVPFRYSREVFDLAEQVNLQIHALFREEGDMTYGFHSLLEGTEYTTEQIHTVEKHLASLSHNTENTRSLVALVYESLNHSTEKIGNAKAGINHLTDQMSSFSSVFEQFFNLFDELQKQFQRINEFANVITVVAKEANFLSLNASIEATRAGHAGASFAVVANEMKQMSNDTRNSAKDIIEILKDMTSVMNSLNLKSNEGAKAVKETTELICNSGVLLDHIVLAENKVQEHVGQVKESQERNVTDVQEISANLSKLVDKSKTENDYFEELIFRVQRKADQYMHILNHLNQIRLLQQEYGTKTKI